MTTDIVIYHNPECGTSRNTLAMIEASGETPDIVEYLKTPPSKAEMKRILKGLGMLHHILSHRARGAAASSRARSLALVPRKSTFSRMRAGNTGRSPRQTTLINAGAWQTNTAPSSCG